MDDADNAALAGSKLWNWEAASAVSLDMYARAGEYFVRAAGYEQTQSAKPPSSVMAHAN